MRPFGYEVGSEGIGEVIDVPAGFQTDFASLPHPFWPWLPPWGRYGNAAVIHGYLCWEQNYERKRADEILREATQVLRVANWKIAAIYWVVRLFGRLAWQGDRRQKRRGIKRVLPLPVKAVEERVLQGDPATAILEAANEMPNVAVAMVTHGTSGVGSWIIGAVTNRVVRYPSGPTLVVRAEEDIAH